MNKIFNYKRRLLNYLRSKGWFVDLNRDGSNYAIMFCWNCGFQRYHKLIGINFIKIPDRFVPVGVFRCTYCYEHGVLFR